MYRNKNIIKYVVILLVFVLAGCGSNAGVKLDTPAGTFKIEQVQISDSFPPDCTLNGGAGCSVAESGYQILIIWLEPPTGFDGSINEAMTEEAPYLTLGDGTTKKIAISGMAQSRYFIAFTPPDSAASFTLTWPDNPTVDLGKLLGD